MAPPLQTKLLRVLQEREVRRVGDNKSAPVNVRVVGRDERAITNRRLKDGTFSQDLIIGWRSFRWRFRLLRERLEDVPLLCTISCRTGECDWG